jgi:hypothetical protein
MKVYEPKVEVMLVKAIKRTEIIPKVPVNAKRYGKSLQSIDLTKYLSENGGVHTSKSIREPAGAWSVTICDKAHPDLFETIYALIEPMDLIEIRMAHDPYEYRDVEKQTIGIPVVMRGFVSMITRNEIMSGDKPIRTVTISGQDFGKILQIIQIIYLNGALVDEYILSEFSFFQKYDLTAKIKLANEFVADVLNGIINPYLAKMTKGIGASIVNVITPNVTIQGSVAPGVVSSISNVSLYQLLVSVLDIGAFNELFIEDNEGGISLTVRPAPFLDVKGNPIQGHAPDSISIGSKDIVAINISRTDAGVANYYWVQCAPWSLISNEDQKAAAMVGPKEGFIFFDYLNTIDKYYGVRKMEVSINLGPPSYSWSDAKKSSQAKEQTGNMGDWIVSKRQILSAINKDNVIFESGSLRVRGNERIKAGMQLIVNRGVNMYSSYYVTKVEHEFVPFQGFYSTLTVERGTNFIDRSQKDQLVYRLEIDGKGD